MPCMMLMTSMRTGISLDVLNAAEVEIVQRRRRTMCDCAFVERVGRKIVLRCCAELGCDESTIRECVPDSAYRHIDLCSECYVRVLEKEAKQG